MQRIGVVVYPGFQLRALVGPTVIDVANRPVGHAVYSLEPVSEAGGPVASALGAEVHTQPIGAEPYDTLVVASCIDVPQPSDRLVEILRTASDRCRRVAASSTSAF